MTYADKLRQFIGVKGFGGWEYQSGHYDFKVADRGNEEITEMGENYIVLKGSAKTEIVPLSLFYVEIRKQ